jgi:hypothetical protein
MITQIDRWPRRKCLIALFRGQPKRNHKIRRHELQPKSARRAGVTEQKFREQSENREDLALVCVGQQANTLMLSVALARDARGSEWEDERGEESNQPGNHGDEVCRIWLYEPGKRQGEGRGRGFSG